MKKIMLLLAVVLIAIPAFSQQYVAAVEKNKKWGYIDEKGDWVLEPRLDAARDFSDGYARVKTGKDWYYINLEGEILGMGAGYEVVSDFSNGYARVKRGDKWGFINTSLEVVIDPVFDGAKDFSDGVASVRVDDVWGYIDENGEWVLEPAFVKAYEFYAGLAMVRIEKDWFFIDKEGALMRSSADYRVKKRFSDDRALVEIDDMFGFIDKNFDVVIPGRFERAKMFSEGSASAMIDGKWGYIDQNGDWLKEPTFDKAYEFHSGVALVKIKKTWYFMDDEFQIFDNPIGYEVIRSFSNGFAKVRLGKLFGVVNTNGELVIPAVYDDVRDFVEVSW